MRTIRTRMTFMIVFVILVSTGLLWMISNDRATKTMTSQLEDGYSDNAKKTAHELTEWIGTNATIVDALAADIECHRLKKYIGAYRALLGQVDAVVFTAGVGEEITPIREGTCRGLESIGICMDYEKNRIAKCRNAESCISTPDSPIKIFVIPTNEELVMTEDVHALCEGIYSADSMRYSFEDPDFIDNARFSAMLQDFKAHPEWERVLAIPPDAKPDLYSVHEG